MPFIAELANGQRIRYSLKRRDRDPFYLCCYRGPDRRRKEKSTKATNQLRAQESAVTIIRREYAETASDMGWQQAVDLLVKHMEAKNLRPGTIEQYKLAIGSFRKLFPEITGPGDVTPRTAENYKVRRGEKVSAQTVATNLNSLSVVFSWFRDVCQIVASNPFAEIEPPELDRKPPRVITAAEEKAFRDWLSKRWNGWRLPLLFLTVKGAIGCRIGELAAAKTKNLEDGRLRFSWETTKGRKTRSCKLSAGLFDELRTVAGPEFIFQSFHDQLREIHQKRGRSHHAKSVRGFTPARLKKWMEDEAKLYFETTGAPRFKLHNFRGTAMTKARAAGVGVDDAAIAFGCHPETMREYYLNPNETEIADSVFDRLNGGHNGPKYRRKAKSK